MRRRQWHPTPVLLPGKSHGWRSLVGCSPWGHWELDTTERLSFHFSLSCIGEGNGNPLQCSCLENPSDGGALWAAVYGVAQSRTRLKRLSSSSNEHYGFWCIQWILIQMKESQTKLFREKSEFIGLCNWKILGYNSSGPSESRDFHNIWSQFLLLYWLHFQEVLFM